MKKSELSFLEKEFPDDCYEAFVLMGDWLKVRYRKTHKQIAREIGMCPSAMHYNRGARSRLSEKAFLRLQKYFREHTSKTTEWAEHLAHMKFKKSKHPYKREHSFDVPPPDSYSEG